MFAMARRGTAYAARCFGQLDWYAHDARRTGGGVVHLGYHVARVRLGVREHLLMIHDRAGELELNRHARTLTSGIREDGWRKVLAGHTSVEEVLRVTRED